MRSALGGGSHLIEGRYADYYRYRVGDYRLFYFVDEDRICVVVATLRQRREAYR